MRIFDKLWVSSTNNSENISLAGTNAVIDEMVEKNTISYCWQIGKLFMDKWNETVTKYNIDAKMHGYPIRMHLLCYDSAKKESLVMKSLILQEMIKRGIFISVLGATFFCYSHSKEDVEKTINALEETCKFIVSKVKNEQYDKFIEGELPKTIWSMKINPTKKL